MKIDIAYLSIALSYIIASDIGIGVKHLCIVSTSSQSTQVGEEADKEDIGCSTAAS